MVRTLALTGLVVVGLGTLGAQVPKPTTVDGPYDHPKAGRIELRGICKFDERDMVCWDATGKPDPVLSERIKAHHLVNSGITLNLRMGRKNRLVVFRRPADANRGVTVNYTTGPGTSLNVTRSGWSAEESQLEWAQVVADPDIPTVSIEAVVFEPPVQILRLPYRAGATTQASGAGATLESITEIKNQQFFGSGWEKPGKVFSATVRLTGDLASPDLQTGYAFEGSAGPVVAVDSKGKVVPRAKFEEEQRARMNNRTGNPRQMEARTATAYRAGQNPDVVQTNVAPDPALTLVVSASAKTTIRFRDIPLDPR